MSRLSFNSIRILTALIFVIISFVVISGPVSAEDTQSGQPQSSTSTTGGAPAQGGTGGTTSVAPTEAKNAVCEGVGLTGGVTNCNDPTAASGTIQNLVSQVISILSYVVGIAAVIMIMIGGFKYITSQGDSNSVSSAKNTILYAVIGLVVALFAQLIVRFVITRV